MNNFLNQIEEIERLKSLAEKELETEKVRFEDSATEKQVSELQQLRQDLNNCMAEYRADKATKEQSSKISERKATIKGIISGAIVTIAGGLVVSYWPNIVSVLLSAFH